MGGSILQTMMQFKVINLLSPHENKFLVQQKIHFTCYFEVSLSSFINKSPVTSQVTIISDFKSFKNYVAIK